MSAQTHATAEI